MNEFMDDLEYEDALDDAELFDDSEAYDDAESRASRARRRRARALAVARQQAVARRTAAPAPSGPRAVVSAVKELDLQTKVQQDDLRAVMASWNRKAERNNLATVALLVVPQLFRTFGEPDNAIVRNGINASPLFLLSPGRQRPGVEGVLRHPAFYGGAAALALGFVEQQRERGVRIGLITVTGPTQLAVKSQALFVAQVSDASGRPTQTDVTWTSNNPTAATIDAKTGQVTANAAGFTVIEATAGGVSGRAGLQVVDSTVTK